MLPAAQTYTDGTVVNWDEKTVAGQAEPKHPAPSFVTTAAESTATAATPINMDQSSNNAVGVWGIVLGAVGLVLGGTALGMVLTGRRKALAVK